MNIVNLIAAIKASFPKDDHDKFESALEHAIMLTHPHATQKITKEFINGEQHGGGKKPVKKARENTRVVQRRSVK